MNTNICGFLGLSFGLGFFGFSGLGLGFSPKNPKIFVFIFFIFFSICYNKFLFYTIIFNNIIFEFYVTFFSIQCYDHNPNSKTQKN